MAFIYQTLLNTVLWWQSTKQRMCGHPLQSPPSCSSIPLHTCVHTYLLQSELFHTWILHAWMQMREALSFCVSCLYLSAPTTTTTYKLTWWNSMRKPGNVIKKPSVLLQNAPKDHFTCRSFVCSIKQEQKLLILWLGKTTCNHVTLLAILWSICQLI